jgi:hypothetical protein
MMHHNHDDTTTIDHHLVESSPAYAAEGGIRHSRGKKLKMCIIIVVSASFLP